MDVVYLDFQKAFNKEPHQRLLIKLKAYGIGGKYDQLDTSMVDRQKTESNSRGGDIKLETSFEWSSIGVGVGTNIIFDIYK